MTIWAIGRMGEPARCYVETTVFQDIMAQVRDSEEVAPVTSEQRAKGVRMRGDMQVEVIEGDEE